MKRRNVARVRALWVAGLLLFAATPAGAVLIDFEGFGNVGTPVTNQFPDVTFSSSSGFQNLVSTLGAGNNFICTAPVDGLIDCVHETILTFTHPVNSLTFLQVGNDATGVIVAKVDIFVNDAFAATVDIFGGFNANLIDLTGFSNVTSIRIHSITDPDGLGWDNFSFNPATPPPIPPPPAGPPLPPPHSDLLVGHHGDVLCFDGATGSFLGPFGRGSSGRLTFGPDGNLYKTTGNNGVVRLNGQTGELIDFFTGQHFSFNTAEGHTIGGINFGPDGNLYGLSIGQVTIYDGTTGSRIDAFELQRLGVASDFTFGPDGNLYVAGRFGPTVLRYNGHTFQFLGALGVLSASSVVFGPDGHLYVAGKNDNNVRRYNGQTGRFIDEFVTPGSGQLADPEDLAFGPDGNLYVSSSGTHSVLRYNGQTGEFIDAFVPRHSGGLSSPIGLAFGGPGCFSSPPPPPPVEAAPTNPAIAIPCTGSACNVRISCNLAESSGTSCANRIDLFVRAAAARLSGDGLAAKAQRRIRFAFGVANIPPAQTANVKLRLTPKGKDIAKRKRGKKLKGVLEIRNAAGAVISNTAIRIRLR